MKSFLVSFHFMHYCQGYESAYTTVLVQDVNSFEEACRKIVASKQYHEAKSFTNQTL